jgi:hypothetical protein
MNLRTTLNTSRLGLQILLAGWVLALTGCSSTPLNRPGSGAETPSTAAYASQLLGPMALPVGTVIRADQSLIIGSGDNWVGRVALDVGRDLDAAYAFFLESYPAQGWTVVSAIRGKTSLMVLTRGDRTATLEMHDGGLMGSTVVMTVAPKNANVAAPKKL